MENADFQKESEEKLRKIFKSNFDFIDMKLPLSRADKLSQERTILANERTMLAHLRTAFALFLLGIGLIKLFEDGFSFYLGAASIAFGIAFILFAAVYYPIRNRRIRKI